MGTTAMQAPQTQPRGVLTLPEQRGPPAVTQSCCISWWLLVERDPRGASWVLGWEGVRSCSRLKKTGEAGW